MKKYVKLHTGLILELIAVEGNTHICHELRKENEPIDERRTFRVSKSYIAIIDTNLSVVQAFTP